MELRHLRAIGMPIFDEPRFSLQHCATPSLVSSLECPAPLKRQKTDERNRAQLKRIHADANSQKSCILLGDSYIERFTYEGPSRAHVVFARELRDCVHVAAVGGDKAAHLLYRMQHGVLDVMRTRRYPLAIMLIGINDIGQLSRHAAGPHDESAVEQCATGIAAVVQWIATEVEKCGTEVYLIAIPGFACFDALQMRAVRLANELLRALKFPVSEWDLLDQNGQMPAQQLVDDVHLNADGYAHFASMLSTMIKSSDAVVKRSQTDIHEGTQNNDSDMRGAETDNSQTHGGKEKRWRKK